MNCVVIRILILLFFIHSSIYCQAQSQEAEQLLLNVEKFAQLKQMLSDLKKGYTILSKGYTTIKDISEVSFQLHQTFLDSLLDVSPVVRNYKKVPEIIAHQISLVKEYKGAFRQFRESARFTPDEIAYVGNVYKSLFDASLKNLDALATVLTAGRVRMSDEERLKTIDRIHGEMLDKILFLRHFNNSTKVLALQRAKQAHDIETTKRITSQIK